MYFASLTLPELTPFVGILASMLIGFYGLLKFVLGQAEKDRDAERKERINFASALTALTKSSERVAEATERAASEAKERNGHLAELAIENNKATLEAIGKIKLASHVKEQHVENQTVDKEIVNSKG